MTPYLLDTHIVLWWLQDDPALPTVMRSLISDRRHRMVVSVATIWEIAIKKALGRIDLPDNFDQVLDAEPFERLNITSAHARRVALLPMLHHDPFDRLLVAQTMVESYTLMTMDKELHRYGVPILSKE